MDVKEYLNIASQVDKNRYYFIKKVEGRIHVYSTYKNFFGKEIQITCNKKKGLYSAYEIFYTESNGRVSQWISEIIERVDNKTMLKAIYDTIGGTI